MTQQPPPGGWPPPQPPEQPPEPPRSALNPPWRNAPQDNKGARITAGIGGGVVLTLLLALPILTGFLLSRTTISSDVAVIVVGAEVVIYVVGVILAIVFAFVPRTSPMLKSACYGALMSLLLHLLLCALGVAGLVVACFAALAHA
jgi:hypothetical protein